jgi:hypothetical protein
VALEQQSFPDPWPEDSLALFYLKRFAGRPMTKLAQEAVDRFLDEHGGVEGLIERGLAAFGDPGEEARQLRGAR